jgi:hypothetical protein
MEQVRAVLDAEEPDYAALTALGVDALPVLTTLVQGGDVGLAAKAAYAAGLFDGDAGHDVVALAAGHVDPVVRLAAAAASRSLPPKAASAVLVGLAGDPDPGVRRAARRAAPERPSAALTAAFEANAPDAEGVEGEALAAGMTGGLGEALVGGLMPGEATPGMPGTGDGLMPGESGRMAAAPAAAGEMPG